MQQEANLETRDGGHRVMQFFLGFGKSVCVCVCVCVCVLSSCGAHASAHLCIDQLVLPILASSRCSFVDDSIIAVRCAWDKGPQPPPGFLTALVTEALNSESSYGTGDAELV